MNKLALVFFMIRKVQQQLAKFNNNSRKQIVVGKPMFEFGVNAVNRLGTNLSINAFTSRNARKDFGADRSKDTHVARKEFPSGLQEFFVTEKQLALTFSANWRA